MANLIVDNTEKICSYVSDMLEYIERPSIFHIMVMQRRKDRGHENLYHSERIIKSYHIANLEQLERAIPEIKELCDFFKARAYINLNPKDLEHCKWRLVKDLLDELEHENHRNLNGIVDGAVSKLGSFSGNTTWIIDIDKPDKRDEAIQKLLDVVNSEPRRNGAQIKDPIVMEIPTVNGLHVIIRPFNISRYSGVKDEYEIKQNSSTLLYASL